MGCFRVAIIIVEAAAAAYSKPTAKRWHEFSYGRGSPIHMRAAALGVRNEKHGAIEANPRRPRIETLAGLSEGRRFSAIAIGHHRAASAEAVAIIFFARSPISPIALANFFIAGMLALTASDKPVLQFWK
jgi:hypothetical protein